MPSEWEPTFKHEKRAVSLPRARLAGLGTWSDFKYPVLVSCCLLSMTLIIKFLFWAFTARDVQAQVKNIEWKHTENLREREARSGGGWGQPGDKGFYDEPAFNVECRSKYYGQEDCNPHSCGIDNKSTCHDSCSVYRRWCDYDYYEWPVRETKQTFGFTHDVSWPNIVPTGPHRRVQRVAEYHVVFRAYKEDEILTYDTKELANFDRFNVEDTWQLEVGHITGNVTPVKRVTAEAE